MKKLILIIFLLLFLVSCTNLNDYVPVEDYDNLQDKYSNLSDKYTSLLNSNSKNINENIGLEEELDLTEDQLEKYKYLLANLNELLSNVYYGYGENSEYFGEFTAFSIKYGERYYILTAGHCVEMNEIKYDKFKFKSTSNNNWIYPELLTYQNNSIGRNDYAIFYSDKIKDGLIVDNDNDLPEYILGNNKSNINIIRSFYDETFNGESGAPIVDYQGEIIGVNTTDIHSYFTKIDTILEAIDNIE